MRSFVSCLMLAMLFSPKLLTAQETTAKKEQIAKALTDYFLLERENIHVHLDKNIFLTTEQVWFKGYVFHRKLNIPFFATTNIFASLIDVDGNILDTQLLYGNIATFSGAFKLNDSFKSGKYYLQFYTNWMNNFTEDESAVYEIEVINPAYGVASGLSQPDPSTINIEFHPEGGTLLQGVVNSIGVSISDCNHNALPVSSIDIVNSTGEIIKKVQINKLGYGRFDIAPDSSPGLKAVLIFNETKVEQVIPAPQPTGVSLEVNNYAVPDKLIVKIRTNSLTNGIFAGKPLYMVIQQDEKSVITEVSFKDGKLEQTAIIPQSDLFNGTNTIRILDSELNQLAERLVYRYYKRGLTSQITQSKTTDHTTELTGKLDYPTMNLSISVLPAGTNCLNENNDILGSLLVTPYLETNRKVGGRYYFESFSKAKHYELDLFLLNQISKYKWRDIMQHPAKPVYTFDMGLSLKATLNSKISYRKDHKVRIMSLGGMFDEQVDINNKGEVYLDNLILADSTQIVFSLLEKGVKKQDLKLYPQVFNNNRKFNKNFKPATTGCVYKPDAGIALDIPEVNKNVIVLEQLELTADKTALRYNRAPGNSQLRGYKITDIESRSFFYILDYIRYHGFDVENDGANVGIYGRTVNTINGQRTTPMIYMDNMQVTDFSLLQNIQTEDVDEFYINQHAVVPSVNNKMGIVRIFMKKDFRYRAKKSADASFMVKNGFTDPQPFENAQYASTSDKGFENFGLIDWQPVILPDANGAFTLKIPYTTQQTIKLLIEGFSADGKLISEIKIINLK